MKWANRLSKLCLCIGLFQLVGCQNFHKPTLQKYFVEKMDDSAFMVVDIPLVSFEDYFDNPDIQELTIVETLKKLNILLFLPRETALGQIKSERNRVNDILKNQDYESIVSIANNQVHVRLMIQSKRDRINEALIQFYQEDAFFGLVRVLGKNMEPKGIIHLFAEMNSSALNNALGNSLDDKNHNILSDLLDAIKYGRDNQ